MLYILSLLLLLPCALEAGPVISKAVDARNEQKNVHPKPDPTKTPSLAQAPTPAPIQIQLVSTIMVANEKNRSPKILTFFIHSASYRQDPQNNNTFKLIDEKITDYHKYHNLRVSEGDDDGGTTVTAEEYSVKAWPVSVDLALGKIYVRYSGKESIRMTSVPPESPEYFNSSHSFPKVCPDLELGFGHAASLTINPLDTVYSKMFKHASLIITAYDRTSQTS
jgi:hypothetical protein